MEAAAVSRRPDLPGRTASGSIRFPTQGELMKLGLPATISLLTLALGACTTAVGSAPASPANAGAPTGPEASPTPAETVAQPSASGSLGPVVVTFEVAGAEEYRIELIDPADIATARRLLAGEAAPTIPNGLVLPGDGGVNAPWSWHIDPADIEFAEITTEVCDGLPSDVEAGAISGPRFCPWTAQVIEISDAP